MENNKCRKGEVIGAYQAALTELAAKHEMQ